MTLNTVSTFTELFSGNRNAYGQFIPGDKAEYGQKQEGTSSTVRALVTESVYRDHLAGQKGLGICPVNEEGKCRFTVIDVDAYNGSQDDLISSIYAHNFPLVPFKSKSGGWHLYTFYDRFIPAKDARKNANFLRTLLGLPANTEVFPKQDIVPKGGTGNWINLPYFGGDGSPRAYIDAEGNPVENVDVAVANISARVIDVATFKTWKESLPLNDAPPCLQSLYLRHDVHERNNYLFSLGCYFKAKYAEDYEQYVIEANDHLLRPLSEKELQQTVFSSLNKHTYSYRCHESPLCSVCNKKECSTRTYKVGDEVSPLSYEQLVQYNCDPPYYDWTINGKVLRFNSETEIIQQEKFIELCMRHLSILPNKIKREAWTAIVNEALKNKQVKEVEYDTSSPLAVMQESLKQFLLSAKLGDNLDDSIGLGRPYLSFDAQTIVVTMKDLYIYASNSTKLKFSNRDIANWLYSINARTSTRKVQLTSMRVWVIDVMSLFDEPADAHDWIHKQMAANTVGANGQFKSAQEIAQEVLNSQMEDDL